MKKNIIKITLFLIILSTTLFYLNNVFKFKFNDGIYGVKTFYELPENSVDVLVLGSSRSYVNINPAILWKEEGIAAYVLGGSIQPLWNTYYYLSEALKTQSPELIVLEAFGTTFEFEYIDSSRIIKNNYGLKFSSNKIDALKISTSPDKWAEFGIEPLQYHNRYQELSKADFLPYMGDEEYYRYWKGFGCSFSTNPQERNDVSHVTDAIALPEKSEKYYRKVIELAQEQNIPILVVVSPFCIKEKEQSYFNQAKIIAEEYGVPFLNSNLFYDDFDLDFSADFSDTVHLNYKGNIKWTHYLQKYIKDHFEISDRRGDEKYTSWDKHAHHYDQMIKDQNLKNTTDVKEYLNMLFGLNNVTYSITLDGNYIAKDYNIDSLLNLIGVSNDGTNSWIVQNKEIIFSNKDVTDYFFHLELRNDHNLAAIGKAEADKKPEKQIIYNTKVQKKVNHGINIFVYDNDTQRHIETIGFDSYKNYEIVR